MGFLTDKEGQDSEAKADRATETCCIGEGPWRVRPSFTCYDSLPAQHCTMVDAAPQCPHSVAITALERPIIAAEHELIWTPCPTGSSKRAQIRQRESQLTTVLPAVETGAHAGPLVVLSRLSDFNINRPKQPTSQ